jgi:hypothetical protein
MVSNAGTVDADLSFVVSSGSSAQFTATCLSNPCQAVKKDMANNPGTAMIQVTYTPTTEGDVFSNLDINLNSGTQMINLIGNGKLRNVDLAPGSIDVGDTFAGIPARLSVTRPGDILTVLNMDQESFNIRDIKISGEDEDVFQLINLDGSAFSAVDIEPGSSQTFDIVFSPTVPGEFTSSVVLYLDDDQDVQKSIPITGRAVYVSAHGAGGCSAGGGGEGGLVVICVAGLFVVRRRRR